ncbi:MAG: cation:proton antiporter, partial [Bacteroidaceae bacterium]|nr:cation:proton antiporter [Bacteroidaceae bacterium]
MDIYVLVLSVAAIVMLSFKKLGQPLVLGYLVAGFLVSPHMDYMQVLGITPVIEREIEDTGQIGVMVIMFCLGLEFSFKKLGSMGKAPFVTSFVAILAMMLLGYFVGMAMGFGEMDCIFLGGMLSMSSTAIIYKAFDELGLSSKSFTSRVMSVLILEDILGVVLLVLLGAIGRGVDDMGEIMGTVIGLAEFVGISLVVGLVFIPWFMRKIRNISNPEVLLMLSIAFMLLLAKTSAYLGFSTALGAFIMGSILSETYEAHKIEHSIQPIKNYLGAVFFVSVGMLVDVQTVVEYWVP